MNHDFIVGGVIVSPLVPEIVLALILTIVMSFVLIRLDAYRLFWHRPLVELAIVCIFLGLIVVLTPDGSPIFPVASNVEQRGL